jgi:hypothetical protein
VGLLRRGLQTLQVGAAGLQAQIECHMCVCYAVCVQLIATDVHPAADVLRLVRDEVLRGLSQRLPAEMQLLDAALKAPSSSAREAVLKQYALPSEKQLAEALAANNIDEVSADTEPASTSIPGGKQRLHCLASDFERAISQVIGDMELMVTVPDRWAFRAMV